MVALQLLRQRDELFDGLDERSHGGQLRPDVHLQPLDYEVRELGGRRIRRRGKCQGDAKLVLALARRDLGVRPGIHIRVDPDRHRRLAAELAGHMIDAGQLGLALHMKREDARLDASRMSASVLPTPAKTLRLTCAPAACTRRNSPPLTTSNAAPKFASRRSNARFEFALSA